MTKILLALGIMALICTPAMAGPNANGAIIVHTNDAYTYLSTTICTTTLLPVTCEEAITTATKDTGQIVWFLAAFLPIASPRVSVIYFGINYDDVNLDPSVRKGMCAPAGSLEAPDSGWPGNAAGNSVAFGTPKIGITLFPFYYFQVDDYSGGIGNPFLCSGINPAGGDAAFVDDAFPGNTDNITNFGCVTWYGVGQNHCPQPIVTTGACCFATGECSLYNAADCAALGGIYGGDDTTCVPTNPCAQPGACCDLETGICRFVLESACPLPFQFLGGLCEPVNPCPQKGACCEPVTGACTFVLADACAAPSVWHADWTCQPNNCPVEPQGACCDLATGLCTFVYAAQCQAPLVWHPEWTCQPNYCPPPVATEPTTWGQIKANYR
jgi:hypothetical protein